MIKYTFNLGMQLCVKSDDKGPGEPSNWKWAVLCRYFHPC